MNKTTRLILIFSLFSPLVSYAENSGIFDGDYLFKGYQLYEKDHNTITQQPVPAAFSGYVIGITTVLAAEQEICLSDSFDINQAFDTVGNWLKNKPQERDNPPAMIVAEALVDKYPCSP